MKNEEWRMKNEEEKSFGSFSFCLIARRTEREREEEERGRCTGSKSFRAAQRQRGSGKRQTSRRSKSIRLFSHSATKRFAFLLPSIFINSSSSPPHTTHTRLTTPSLFSPCRCVSRPGRRSTEVKEGTRQRGSPFDGRPVAGEWRLLHDVELSQRGSRCPSRGRF